ncbi:MAG: CobD/CbiB family protein [Methylophilaceae bacterium]|nr:CobD/CbiB family protein [Methylophilaceae bacterium]
MNFLALISALVLCYYFPQPKADYLQQVYRPYVRLLLQRFSDGSTKIGIMAWLLGVLLPVLAIALMEGVLLKINAFPSFLFNVAILYFTLQFSHFGQQAEHIANALRDNNIDLARQLFSAWDAGDASAYQSNEIARASIEATLKQAHHGLFAPIIWFAILGPAGAVLYALAYLFKRQWPTHSAHQQLFCRIFNWLNWLPARITASSFAIVGDFEDAIYCWRAQASSWPDFSMGIILASGAGALGVKLGESLFSKGVLQYRPELGLGDEADADYLQSAVGLVWRVIILMAGLMFLLTFANWLGD